MSRIDELIAELCPSGVKFRRLGDIARIRNGKDHKHLGDGDIPVYGSGGVMRYADSFSYAKPSVLIPRKGSLGNLFYVDVPFWNVDTIFHTEVDEEQTLPKFLYYFLTTVGLGEMNQAGGIPSQTQSVLNELKVPVPLLDVQREIVRILDTFTELEAQLEAELEARRAQYVHYRQAILRQIDADAVPLSSLGSWHGGVTPSKANPAYWESGTIPWLASMDVSNEDSDEIRGRVTPLAIAETPLRLLPSPSVAVVMRSNILRRVLPIGLIKVDTTVNQDMRLLVPGDGVDAEYVFQALKADSEQIRSACVRTDGSMAAVDSQGFLGWKIPLPPLDEQRRIAERLRHFDALVSDLSIGLPAELNARRKQYEHYRDRLLTFAEAA
jgi:type I restriction enzyme S subunit